MYVCMYIERERDPYIDPSICSCHSTLVTERRQGMPHWPLSRLTACAASIYIYLCIYLPIYLYVPAIRRWRRGAGGGFCTGVNLTLT